MNTKAPAQPLTVQAALLRRQKMIARHNEGLTLGEIGDEFGVTRERVRQIFVQEGVLNRNYRSKKSRDEDKRLAALKPDMLAAYREQGSADRTAQMFGTTAERLMKVIGDSVTELDMRMTKANMNRTSQFRAEDYEMHMKRALALQSDGYLSAEKYEAYARATKGAPSHQTVMKWYGTWRSALQQTLGMECLPSGASRGFGAAKYTDADMLDALERMYRDSGKLPIFDGYRQEQLPTEPSCHVIRARFGSWTAALRLMMARLDA